MKKLYPMEMPRKLCIICVFPKEQKSIHVLFKAEYLSGLQNKKMQILILR